MPWAMTQPIRTDSKVDFLQCMQGCPIAEAKESTWSGYISLIHLGTSAPWQGYGRQTGSGYFHLALGGEFLGPNPNLKLD